MIFVRGLALALAVAASCRGAAAADGHSECLSQDQRRAAIASHRAIPLAKAIHAAKARPAGEIVGARLCEDGNALVYVLTVLAHDGKVTRVKIDGASGALRGH